MANARGALHGLSAKLRGEYEDRLRVAEDELTRLPQDQSEARERTKQGMRRSLLLVEKEALLKAQHHGLIANGTIRPVADDVDARLAHLDRAKQDES